MATLDTLRLTLIVLLLSVASACGKLTSSLSEQISVADVPSWQTSNACRVVLSDVADTRITTIQKRIHKQQNVTAWLEQLGWAYIDKAKSSVDNRYYDLVQQTAKCLQALEPGNAEALLLFGLVALNRHDFSQAEHYARSLTQSRNYWADYALLGDALLEQGTLKGATQAYQVLMDTRPGLQAYTRAAELNWRMGNLSPAIAFMELAISATNSRDSVASAWTHTRLAELHLQALNYPLAAKYARTALSLHADYAPALHVIAKTALAQGEWQQAIDFNQRAIAVQALPHYLWLQIEALRARDTPAEANELERLLLSAGESSDPRVLALYLAGVKGDGQRALLLADHEIQHRQDASTHDAAAWAYWSVGDAARAQQHIEQALASGIRDARLYYHASIIYAGEGDNQREADYYQQAVRLQALLMPSERTHLHSISVATLAPNNRLAQSDF